MAGAAQLDILLKARDQASAVIKSVDRELAKARKTTEATTGSTNKMSSAWAKFNKEGEKVNRVKESLSRFRELVMFAIPAVAGLAGGLVALATEVLGTESALGMANARLDDFKSAMKEAEAAGKAMDSLLEKMGEGLEGVEKDLLSVATATRKLATAERELAFQQLALRAVQGARQATKDAGPFGTIIANMLGVGGSDAEVTEKDTAVFVAQQQVDALRKKLDDLATTEAFRKIFGGSGGGTSASSTRSRGGRGGRAATQRARGGFNPFTHGDPGADADALTGAQDRGLALIAQTEMDNAIASQLTEHAQAMDAIAEATARANEQAAIYAETQSILGAAVEDTARRVVGGFAEQFLGAQGLMALEAVWEFAKGLATQVTNPVESATHFAAAAALGTGLAMSFVPGGGGSGGGGGGGGRGGGAALGGSGDRSRDTGADSGTTVYNISAGVMDAASVIRAIRDSERRAAGTGWERRRGF